MVKFLIVGCGSIGRRHIRNLLSIGEKDIIAVDINKEYLNWVKDNLHVKTYSDMEKAIKEEKSEVALICTPPIYHIPLADIAADYGLHLFIEKPLSNNLNGVNELIRKVNKKRLKAIVGYNQRFNEVIVRTRELVKQEEVLYARILVGQYLPDWRPWQDYRKSYTALKKLGGGIILDASHELDYVRWMFGEPDRVDALAGKLSSLEVETEDTAEIIMKIKSMVVNVHLDFVRRDQTRNGEAVSLNKTIQWDMKNNAINIYHGEEKRNERIEIKQEMNDTYVKEMEHFIDVIKNDKEPLITLEDASKTLGLALKIKKKAGI